MSYFSELNRLRRKETKYGEMFAYHYGMEREWAMKAYELDHMAQPLRWGQRMNQAIYHRQCKKEYQEKLAAVTKRIREIEND